MVTRIAINGFGRIGRLVLRALEESKEKDLKVIAINDLGSAEFNAHLLNMIVTMENLMVILMFLVTHSS